MPKMHLSRDFARRTKRALRPKRLSHSSSRRALARFLDSPPVICFLLLATLYLLFAHDIIAASGAALTRALSATIGAIDLFVAVIFLAEFIANVIAYKKRYVLSWYSLLDLIALLSLIPDIMQFLFLVDVNSELNQFRLARVARTARLATRMARLPKLFDLLHCGRKRREVEEVEPSAIAQQLQDKISAKVIVAVLLITLVATLCNQPVDLTPHAKMALRGLQVVAINTNFTGPLYQEILDLYLAEFNVLQLRIAGNTIVDQERAIDRMQTIYLYKVNIDSSNAIISDKKEHQEIYGLSIVQTACTIIILFLACLLISRDMLGLVIRPIERMLGLIKKLTTTIASQSADNSRYDSYSDSDDDEDGAGGEDYIASDVESGTTDMDDDERETNLLVEFVDIVAQQQLAMETQRKEEHNKRKMLAVLEAGVHGWIARKKYKKITKTYFSRAQVARELASTEKSFVTSLLALRNVFIVPLRESDILDQETVQSMFLGVEAVFNYSKSLMTKIDSRMHAWNVHSKIDDLFEPMDDLVDAYSEYINNYNHASEAILKYKESNPKFLEFVKEQEKHPACNYQTIESFLIMPVQRPPRYVMLMETFAKYTPEDHPDFTHVQNVAADLKKATTLINERKRDAENRALVQSIYIRLEPPVDLLMNNGCVFLKESALKYEGDSYYYYLFTNVLLKCQKQGGSQLQVLQEIPVSIFVRVTKVADSPHYDLENAFQIETTTSEIHLLVASTNALQNEWVEAMTQCIPKPKKEHKESKKRESLKPHLPLSPSTLNMLATAGPSNSPRLGASPGQNSPRRRKSSFFK